jgi:hypothetical protein
MVGWIKGLFFLIPWDSGFSWRRWDIGILSGRDGIRDWSDTQGGGSKGDFESRNRREYLLEIEMDKDRLAKYGTPFIYNDIWCFNPQTPNSTSTVRVQCAV